MEWIKVETSFDHETGDHESNVYGYPIMVYSNGVVQQIEEHGWDGDEYYFHDGCGKMDNVTHWMPLPHGPELNDKH